MSAALNEAIDTHKRLRNAERHVERMKTTLEHWVAQLDRGELAKYVKITEAEHQRQ